MAFLRRIRKKAGRFILKHKIDNHSRNREFVNLDAAQTVGILFHHIDTENFGVIKNFVRKLEGEGKKVSAVGYIEKKEVPNFYLVRKGFDFICLEDLNWYCSPQTSWMHDFLEKEFDVMINLSIDKFFPVEYIYALSRAKFKAGKQLANWEYDDLTVDIKESRDIQHLINQISHYLREINKKQ